MYFNLYDILEESATTEALKFERAAFNKIRSLPEMKAFVTPRGKTNTFPDFAFSTNVDGKVVDLHFEYKKNAVAQMGGLTRWSFDGASFSSTGGGDDSDLILDLMNTSAPCIRGGRRILINMRKAFGAEFPELSGGMLNKYTADERRAGLLQLYKSGGTLSLAHIEDARLGEMMLDHYKSKFKPRAKADLSVLIFMVGNTVGWVDAVGEFDANMQNGVAAALGITHLPKITAPIVNLEVRVQPKHMSEYRELVNMYGKKVVDRSLSKGEIDLDSPTLIMMANFRMRGYTQGAEL